MRNLYFPPPLETPQEAVADSQNPMLCEDYYSTISSPELWEVKPRKALIIFQLPLTCLVEIWDGLSGKRWLCFYNRILREGSKVFARKRPVLLLGTSECMPSTIHYPDPQNHSLTHFAGDVWNSILYPIPDTVFPKTLVRLTHILIITCYRDLCNFAIHVYILTYLHLCSIQPRRNHSLHTVTYFFYSTMSA